MSEATQSPRGGLLAVWVTAPADLERDFVAWYEMEHLPERVSLPGFRSAVLLRGVDEPTQYMALYELDSASIVDGPEYLEVKARPFSPLSSRVREGWRDHQRIVYDLQDSTAPAARRVLEHPHVFSVRLGVLDGWADRYRVWLRDEHVDRMLAVDGVGAHEGYEPVQPPHHFLNLWGVDDPSAVGSPEWESARATPWRDMLADGRGQATRGMYRPILGT